MVAGHKSERLLLNLKPPITSAALAARPAGTTCLFPGFNGCFHAKYRQTDAELVNDADPCPDFLIMGQCSLND
jgi:hypothetical protein